MGLKVSFSSSVNCCVECSNQTKMGLKGSPRTAQRTWCFETRVQIRPKWDWKQISRIADFFLDSRSNQTKMGLKACERFAGEECVWSSNQTKMGLKGTREMTIAMVRNVFKSDQNGIERNSKEFRQKRLRRVQIRPKWDWKRRRWRRLPCQQGLFKSDQNGIESFFASSFGIVNAM